MKVNKLSTLLENLNSSWKKEGTISINDVSMCEAYKEKYDNSFPDEVVDYMKTTGDSIEVFDDVEKLFKSWKD